MRGNPDPFEVRKAKGNTSGRPMPDAVERVEGDLQVPTCLGEEGLKCWLHVTEILKRRGQLSRDSHWSLIALCACWEEWHDLQMNILAFGRTERVLTNGGQKAASRKASDSGAPLDTDSFMVTKIRPEVAMFQDCDRRLRSWLNEFGLTDISRAKVEKIPTDPQTGAGPGNYKRKPKTGGASDYGLD